MKKVVLLGSFLLLLWMSSGAAAAQSLPSLPGPLKDVVDKIKAPVDKIKAPIEKALPPVTDPVKKPVEDVTKDVGKTVDKIVKDVTDVAKNPTVPSGDKPDPQSPIKNLPGAGQSDVERPAKGAAATKTKATSASKGSRGSSKGSGGAGRTEPARDTEQVAAAGNTIEPAEVRGTQIVAPATEAEETGSGLSLTGAQILTWLILACGLLGAGTVFVLSGRMRSRTASS